MFFTFLKLYKWHQIVQSIIFYRYRFNKVWFICLFIFIFHFDILRNILWTTALWHSKYLGRTRRKCEKMVLYNVYPTIVKESKEVESEIFRVLSAFRQFCRRTKVSFAMILDLYYWFKVNFGYLLYLETDHIFLKGS